MPLRIDFTFEADDEYQAFVKRNSKVRGLARCIADQIAAVAAAPELAREYRGPGSLRYHVFQCSDGTNVASVRVVFDVLDDEHILVVSVNTIPF